MSEDQTDVFQREKDALCRKIAGLVDELVIQNKKMESIEFQREQMERRWRDQAKKDEEYAKLLMKERDEARAKVTVMRERTWVDEYDNVCAERDRLSAEVERLRAEVETQVSCSDTFREERRQAICERDAALAKLNKISKRLDQGDVPFSLHQDLFTIIDPEGFGVDEASVLHKAIHNPTMTAADEKVRADEWMGVAEGLRLERDRLFNQNEFLLTKLAAIKDFVGAYRNDSSVPREYVCDSVLRLVDAPRLVHKEKSLADRLSSLAIVSPNTAPQVMEQFVKLIEEVRAMEAKCVKDD